MNPLGGTKKVGSEGEEAVAAVGLFVVLEGYPGVLNSLLKSGCGFWELEFLLFSYWDWDSLLVLWGSEFPPGVLAALALELLD